MTLNTRELQSLGLCPWCSDANSCMNWARAKSPIWYCEQYHDSGPPRGNPHPVFVPDTLVVAEPVEVADGQTRGICCNCENMATCLLSTSEGGVWHCEEYR